MGGLGDGDASLQNSAILVTMVLGSGEGVKVQSEALPSNGRSLYTARCKVPLKMLVMKKAP